MGPEDSFKVEPGRIWLVPLDADGQEPQDISEAREMRAEDWSWGEGQEDDPGSDGGLEGGLQGWPDGPLEQVGKTSYSMEFELSPEAGEGIMAALMGRSVSEYRDLKRWVREARWLKAITGLNWGSFE